MTAFPFKVTGCVLNFTDSVIKSDNIEFWASMLENTFFKDGSIQVEDPKTTLLVFFVGDDEINITCHELSKYIRKSKYDLSDTFKP